MSIKQQTIAGPITLKGKGLHTGLEVEMTFHPAPENHGYKIKRKDLEGEPVIEALAEYVVDTARGTVLEKNGIRVGTIEHVLAALYGLEIDNCLIELNAPEAPIMDGSARFFVEAIGKVGILEQKAEREYFTVSKKIAYQDPENGVELVVLPDDDYSVNTMIAFDSRVLNNQYALLSSLKDFEKEIAPCRTFVFVRELEFLLNNNLIKGGDMDNAIVIMDKKIPQVELDRLADLLGKPHLEVHEAGVLNNIELQFNNECARHKLMDVIGDLALVGKFIKGRIIATRPGHSANTKLAKEIRKEIKRQANKAPCYDPKVEPLMDVKRVKELLPHRPPFLLVDKILRIEGNDTIIGVKNVTMNEGFFVGHFPEEPVMPGVLIVEAMAQTGGILVLNSVDEPETYSTYFLKIDNVKFRKKVVPGDTCIFKLELMTEIRRGCANMRGTAYVGDTVVTEAEFMAQIIKNK